MNEGWCIQYFSAANRVIFVIKYFSPVDRVLLWLLWAYCWFGKVLRMKRKFSI